MPGSKNRKKAKLEEKNYKDIKNNDADKWSEFINKIVKDKDFPRQNNLNTLEKIVHEVDVYFEFLKCAFPVQFVPLKELHQPDRESNVTNMISLNRLRNDFNLKTLEKKTDTTTAKWLTLVNEVFTQIKNLCAVSVWQISWDTSRSLPGDFTKKCKNLAKLLKISPFYFGHCPLIKYSQVRKAFAKLSETIEKFPSKILEILKTSETTFPDNF